jgi:Phospholipase_D-nuclease N-terminal
LPSARAGLAGATRIAGFGSPIPIGYPHAGHPTRKRRVAWRRPEEEGETVEWTFGTVIWSMVVFFFWFMFIWMFISIFTDIFRRDDLSGWGKAAWIFLIAVLPFLGILIYMIARPKMTEQDRRRMAEAKEAQRRMAGYSPAEEIAKLAKLKDEGKISAQEYEDLKSKAMA